MCGRRAGQRKRFNPHSGTPFHPAMNDKKIICESTVLLSLLLFENTNPKFVKNKKTTKNETMLFGGLPKASPRAAIAQTTAQPFPKYDSMN